MKKIIVCLILVFLIGCNDAKLPAQLNYPSDTPVLFAENIVSVETSKETTCALAPDNQEFYFSRQTDEGNLLNPVIWVTEYDNGEWLPAKKVSFSSTHRDFNPFITPDNQYLLFYRMVDNETEQIKSGTWYAKRNENGWDEPVFLVDAYCVTTVDFETFYYSPIKGENANNIMQFTYKDGLISDHKLIENINSDFMDCHPVISPTGDFIIFDSLRPGGYDKGDMYISFKNSDDTWSEAVNLGEKINNGFKGQPSISHDGKYLFFNYDEDIYWVEININDLQP